MTRLPPLAQRTLDLVGALRRAGVPVSVSEDLEAVTSLGVVDLLDRAQLREALAAVLVKEHANRRTFDELFDLYFPARHGTGPAPAAGNEDVAADDGDAEGYLEDLLELMMSGDDETIRRMAREAVDRFGRAEGRDGGEQWFQYRVMRAVDLPALLQRLLDARAAEHGGEPTDLERRLWRDEFEARLRAYREEVESEIRRRYVEQRGADAVAGSLVKAPLAERDLFRLSAQEQRELHAEIRPLARKLASRVAVKRRRGRDGRLDVRRTVRRSLSTGGVPFDPEYRSRKPHKPELFVICDVSGSVASFARFTLLLVHALQDEFSKVRSFAFVDTLDEVSELFEPGDVSVSVGRIMQQADLIWFDGHSDYGHSFEVFHRRYAREITPRSTVVILGDARNNYRKANGWVLEDVKRRARRLIWLNPEPIHFWGSGDSIALNYARYCDEMVEVRNLKQLSEFVERLV